VTPIPAACGVVACNKNTEGAAAPHGGIILKFQLVNPKQQSNYSKTINQNERHFEI